MSLEMYTIYYHVLKHGWKVKRIYTDKLFPEFLLIPSEGDAMKEYRSFSVQIIPNEAGPYD